MKLSQLFFKTFKQAPSDADIPSHIFLEKAGYIRKLDRGLFSLTPLMWRVIKKINALIRHEMDAAGAQEVQMPHLHPKTIWEVTSRWQAFSQANLLYTFEDRQKRFFCLAPTHEEAVVELVKNWITSYKQLPVNLYQITQKFRDEIRPRFGLMRSKEFLMKDAYAFCADEDSMDKQYEAMRQAYKNIFDRLQLDYAIVKAHGGSIGTGRSEEFQVLADAGEDGLLICEKGHAYNVEAAPSIVPPYSYDSSLKEKELVSTPCVDNMSALGAFLKVDLQRTLKTLVYKLIYDDREEFLAVGIRGDRAINEIKLQDYAACQQVFLASDEEVKTLTKASCGYVGPCGLAIDFVADKTCEKMKNFVCGANEDHKHFVGVNWERDCKYPSFHDFLLAQEGDFCLEHPGCALSLRRGIEVGHIFNLGSKYSQALEAHFLNPSGKPQPFYMGCYGIGVTRLAQACIEQMHDAKGLVWPSLIAPYHVVILAATKNPILEKAAGDLYDSLRKAHIDVLLDDRKERLGFKLKDSDLMGIPYKIIVGKSFEADSLLELETRFGEKSQIPYDQVMPWAEKTFSSFFGVSDVV